MITYILGLLISPEFVLITFTKLCFWGFEKEKNFIEKIAKKLESGNINV